MSHNKRIRSLIEELNDLAYQRKQVVDRLWLLETQGEEKRMELMGLLKLWR